MIHCMLWMDWMDELIGFIGHPCISRPWNNFQDYCYGTDCFVDM